MEIKNVEVFGMKDSVIRSGYPKRYGDVDSNKSWDINRARKLGSCPISTGHDNFLNGIIVQFDIKYPQYFSLQMQRYHFLDFISSQSKMHTIALQEDITTSCNKWVDIDIIEIINEYIKLYNNFEKEISRLKNLAMSNGADLFEKAFHLKMVEKVCVRDKRGNKNFYDKKDLFMKIISNLPMGFELWAGMTTNYRQLKTIYFQRKNHKLSEWNYFCNWIEQLPNFKYLILGEKEDEIEGI